MRWLRWSLHRILGPTPTSETTRTPELKLGSIADGLVEENILLGAQLGDATDAMVVAQKALRAMTAERDELLLRALAAEALNASMVMDAKAELESSVASQITQNLAQQRASWLPREPKEGDA